MEISRAARKRMKSNSIRTRQQVDYYRKEAERYATLFEEYSLRLAGALGAADGNVRSLEGAAPAVANCPTINKVMEIRKELDALKARDAARAAAPWWKRLFGRV